jgi:hypothetical protein
MTISKPLEHVPKTTNSPAGFHDPKSGNIYVVYKIDGNNSGDGGNGGNGNDPVPTPIKLQKPQGDWMTPDGSAPITSVVDSNIF